MKTARIEREPDYKLVIRLGIKKALLSKEDKMRKLAHRIRENIEAAIREVIGDENLIGEVDDGGFGRETGEESGDTVQ